MARLTDEGQVKRPMPGVPGLHQAWQDLNAWLGGELPDHRKRLILVRKGDPGGGGGHHSEAWDAGYAVALHNAVVALNVAFGLGSGGARKERPAQGTDKRNGYDAGAAAAALAVSRIES